MTDGNSKRRSRAVPTHFRSIALGKREAIHDGLLESHPIQVDAGFDGHPGVEGGAWRPSDGGDDGLVNLRFAGTEDLPLHVHELSDRLLVVSSGVGLFHYLPDEGKSRELRSVVVDAGDAVLFTRRLVHTFTAPLGDLTLLSYHAPLFQFEDPRLFTPVAGRQDDHFALVPDRLVSAIEVAETGTGLRQQDVDAH